MRSKLRLFMAVVFPVALATSAGYAVSLIPTTNITEPSNSVLLVTGILGLFVSRYLSPKPQAKNG